MIKLIEERLKELVMGGKIHPNTAREALDRFEASLSLKQNLIDAECASSYQQAFEILRNSIKKIVN